MGYIEKNTTMKYRERDMQTVPRRKTSDHYIPSVEQAANERSEIMMACSTQENFCFVSYGPGLVSPMYIFFQQNFIKNQLQLY